MKLIRTIIYFVIFLQTGIILHVWLQHAASDLTSNLQNVLLSLGRLAGLLSVYFILLQVLLRARISLLERIFGYETLNYLHKKNGYVAFTFLLLHPVLLSIGFAIAGRRNIIAQIFLMLFTFEGVMNAFLGWIIFISVVLTSIYIVRKKLRYELWYLIHLGTYIAVFFAWTHQLVMGTDFAGNQWFVNYWYGLYIVVFGSLLYWRIFKIFYLSYKHQFVVDKVIPETEDTVSIYIRGKNLASYVYEPGQFIFTRFLSKDLWWESHPFSFSAVPNNNFIRITVKAEGDFTEKIRTVKPGTPVSLDTPHGAFIERFMKKDKVLFIAGGVGITPIRSLIEGIGNRKQIQLFYANKTSQDIILKKELEELSGKFKFPIYHVISREEGYKGIKGRINAELLKKYINNLQDYDIFICGPETMAKSLSDELINTSEVEKEQIYYENFAL